MPDMDRYNILRIAGEFLEGAQAGCITSELAISDRLVGLILFDAPLLGVAAAADPLFLEYKDPSVIGDHFLLPADWLPEARSVVSLFLPFSQAVRDSNRIENEPEWPSAEWLHGRIEGQALIARLTRHLVDSLEQAGHRCVAPLLDERFKSGVDPATSSGLPTRYTSNWSERHVAHACGLGTFGLSRGLITRRGMAGRFTSLITDLTLEPDIRPYAGHEDYCIRCGTCAEKCPIGAITLENGKDHEVCSMYGDLARERFQPRYGCGKCQVGVPCEARIPAF